jgi:hypothetical protein
MNDPTAKKFVQMIQHYAILILRYTGTAYQ